jgi:uncharacterized protein
MKKVVILLVLFTISLEGCYRKSSPPPPRVPTVAPVSGESTFPKQLGLINDYANVLDSDAKRRIQPVLDALLRDLDVEFAVVTIDTTGKQSVFDYSLAMSRDWNVGKSGKGLLYLLAIEDRHWRIQVSTGLEKDLPNDVCAKLHEPIVPLLKDTKYGDAVELYVRAIDQRLRANK